MFVATDIHYLAEKLNDHGEAFQQYLSSGDGKQLNYVGEITDAFLDEVMQKKPDTLIISGDLTNNGEKESHLELADKLKKVEKAGIRIYVIPGNHDILNPWARGFRGEDQYVADRIDADDFRSIYRDFGYEEAVSKDKSTLSYLVKPSNDLWLLMLDTCIYDFNEMMGSPMTNGEIDQDTLNWITECGEMAKEKHAQIAVVMHHNLLDHSTVVNNGFTLDNNEKVLEVFKSQKFNLILSGHIHIQNIQSSEGEDPIYDIATSALSVYPVQYGILKYSASRGFEYNTSKVDVESWARKNELANDDLKSFNAYVKDNFLEFSYRQSYEKIAETGSYSEQDNQFMAETVSILNVNYFAGTVDSVKEEIVNSKGYELWSNGKDPVFLKDYVLSMLSDRTKENNHLIIRNKNK
jgi:3',5'-cyclic AMP phosphodiesterase CpdA